MLSELDLDALRRWVVAARADLTTHADALDRLNVFPVPDGDTGSNMRVTVQQAVQALAGDTASDLTAAAALLAREMLRSARGNSGVILSQLVGGVAAVVQEQDGAPLDGAGLARALRAASDRAWSGVARPVEGTILSVARAAAEGAESAVGGTLAEVAQAAVDGASEALERTTDQLRVLRNAGVVDAGGAGYLLVLEALLRVVRGRAGLAAPDRLEAWLPAEPSSRSESVLSVGPGAHADLDGPAYEVMYLLDHTDALLVEQLRATLDALGDSLVVAGGPQLWSVHVHTDDIAGALEAGATAGRPHQFSVTRFADATDHREPTAAGLRLAAVVSGSGLAELVRRRGGTAIPDSGVAASRLTAVLDDAAGVVLCDSETARAAADEAAEHGADLIVSGRHPAHLVAALDILDLEAPVPDTTGQLAACEAEVRTFAHDGAPDDVVGALADQLDTAELVTVVTGARVAPDDAERLVELVRSRGAADLEVVLIAGGFPSPDYAIGVE